MPQRFDQVSAVLLCGGRSERLGFPKEMLRVDGAPLAVQMLRRLKGLFEDVALSTNHPAYLRHLVDVPVLADEQPDAGPMAGIVAGLKASGGERVFFLACDMPTVQNDLVAALVHKALHSSAQAVCARASGVIQPLCAVYSTSLLPLLERTLSSQGSRSVTAFLQGVETDCVEAPPLPDVDTPPDLHVLKQVFSDVEPLPVRALPVRRLGAPDVGHDLAAEEWPVAVYANGVQLATVLCLPAAVRELAIGFAAYLGLVERREQVRAAQVDYGARRASLQLDVEDHRIRNAVRLLVASTCGANLYGPPLPELPKEAKEELRVSRSHLLECLQSLRQMAPVFERTGCTHQAAYSDGQRISIFYEDIGRHNALDKVVGDALAAGVDTTRGVLLTTGRLNAEVVVKAVRQRVPVLASRSAATTHAVLLAERYGLTLAGFARNDRVNLYSWPERVLDA